MEKTRLKSLAEIGVALWANPEVYQQKVQETVTALALLEEDSLVGLEKGAMALLARVHREGLIRNNNLNKNALQNPFYRLDPEERFVLIALHSGKWNYQAIGRVMEMDPSQLQQFAWTTRLKLAGLLNHQNTDRIPYPSAPSTQPNHRGASCPEFDSAQPWAQRFLDDNIEAGTDRVFLQNHLMACDTCRKYLNRCREFYHRIEAVVPRLSDQDQFLPVLAKSVRRSEIIRTPSKMTFVESLGPVMQRADFWLGVGALIFFIKHLRF